MSSSTLPVVRGGRANLALPILGIGLVLLWQIWQLDGTERYLLGGFVLFWMAIGWQTYFTTLTRLTFTDVGIEVMFPLHVASIRYDEIRDIKFKRHTLSSLVNVKIRTSISQRTVKLSITGPYTPWGTLEDCVQRIKQELIARGVPLRS